LKGAVTFTKYKTNISWIEYPAKEVNPIDACLTKPSQNER